MSCFELTTAKNHEGEMLFAPIGSLHVNETREGLWLKLGLDWWNNLSSEPRECPYWANVRTGQVLHYTWLVGGKSIEERS